jgi:O-acetylserine/cysteine efflux transporter
MQRCYNVRSIIIRWCFTVATTNIAVAIIWGANFVVIDAGLHDMPPLTFVALRFVAVLVPAIFFVKRPDARWRDILLIGLFLSLGQFGLLYLSLDLGMPPGLASLVVQVQVIFTVVIAALAPANASSSASSSGWWV